MVLVVILTLVTKPFPKESRMIITLESFKGEKKAAQIVPKRSAVNSTSQKDPPLLSHKGVGMYLKIFLWLYAQISLEF